MIPNAVKNVLWSYKKDKISPKIHAKIITSQVLNYGNHRATKWLFGYYTKKRLKEIANSIPKTQWNKKSLALWSLVLDINPKNKCRVLKGK